MSDVALPRVRLAFAGREVSVASDAPAVLEAVAATFALMLASGDRAPGGVGHVSAAGVVVRAVGDAFDVDAGESARVTVRSVENVRRFVEDQVRRRFMDAIPELYWLHAGAVERDGDAIVLPAPSGSGKSTLVATLCARGWRYMSDEAVPLDLDADEVFPFPQSPAMRIPSVGAVDVIAARALDKRPVAIAATDTARSPARLGAIVFPRYEHGAAARLEAYATAIAVLELARSSMNFREHAETAIPRLAALLGRVPAYRLPFSDPAEAADRIDEVVARRGAEGVVNAVRD